MAKKALEGAFFILDVGVIAKKVNRLATADRV